MTLKEIADSIQNELPYEILLGRIDHKSARLTRTVDHDCTVDLLDMRNNAANMVYQASLTLLYIKAVHDVFDEKVRVEVHNSLSKGLYTTIHTGRLDDSCAEKIEKRMRELVDLAIPFEEEVIDRRGMTEHSRSLHRIDQLKLIESATDLEHAHIYTLLDEKELYYSELVPDTSYLKWFEVRRYKNGVLLRFPHQSKPDEVPEYEEQKLLYSAFSESARWCRIMNVETAADLNRLVTARNYTDLILLSEALHEKKIAEIAEQIHREKKRIILIAGPSSSGKTTFAKRLIIQLRVTGLRPLYLGTDDYFREREETPVGKDGKPDFEGLDALDSELFNAQMNDLLNGKKVDIPTFDFKSGHKQFGSRIISIDSTQPVVIEGLHCLNPALTNHISDSEKFKIYISPLTQLNIDSHNRIPTTDARMLRRIVRDAQFRGYPASKTIGMWPSVRAGEEVNIFPFNQEADVFFNSQCLYELAVLKKYAKTLLEEITIDEPEYPEARRMLRFLEFFTAVDDDSMIPNNSIMREFIGGSVIAQ